MRERFLLDPGWRFHLGDLEDTARHGYLYPYMHTKTECGCGPAAMDFDDSGWPVVDLPHDYVVRGTPDPKELTNFGCLRRDNAWYRRYFRLEPGANGKRAALEFEGVMSKSRIWVNGCYMGMHESGYQSFEIDFSEVARYGDDWNVVSVYVDTTEYEAWWYEGGGIYRHVWLDLTEPVSVDRWGVWIHPEKERGERWLAPVETTIRNDGYREQTVSVRQSISGADGAVLASEEAQCSAAPREKTVLRQRLAVMSPRLWSPEEPNLYTLTTEIRTDGILTDRVQTVFGFRIITFDPDKGFFLNGMPTLIRGMCQHEDHGGLGAALPDEVKEFRVRRLKEMGCNGYRFSHNPHSPETLEACDRLGMLVMDENRWFTASRGGLEQLEMMIRRDRNHPSVILWSMGNEEFLQARESGGKIMRAMRACVRRLDPTRPVTMAMHTGLLEHGAIDFCDVVGMNYNIELCAEVHARHPDKAIVFSECQNVSEGEDALGDREAGIRTWQIVSELPYVCGLFAWTGMSYRGEHDYPNLFAPCGCMDYLGYPNPGYDYYRACWGNAPMAQIYPHWNQKVPAGTPVQVRVLSTGDEVSLYLNGRLLGTKPSDLFRQCDWLVPFEPGELRAVVTRQGRHEAECVRRTTGAAQRLTIAAEQPETAADGTVIFTICALDAAGERVSDAAQPIQLHVEGGQLLMLDNGDVQDCSDRTEPVCRLYRGICQAIVRRCGAEELRLQVRGDGLQGAQTVLPCSSPAKQKTLPAARSLYVNRWEVSDWLKDAPVEHTGSYAGQTTLHAAEVGHGTVLHDLTLNSGYLLYHAVSAPPACAEGQELTLRFELVEGFAHVTVSLRTDSGGVIRREARKQEKEPGEMTLCFGCVQDPLQAEIWVALGITMPFDGVTKAVRWERKEGGRG